MRKRTWEILSWSNRPENTTDIELACPKCLYDAFIPIGDPGALVIAAIGLGLVFDPPGHQPPENFMPEEIRCRNCKTVWASNRWGVDDVR